MFRKTLLWALLAGIGLIAGCSKYLPRLDQVLPDKRTEYLKSKSLPDLEAPPDLTSDSIHDDLPVPQINAEGDATYSTYQERIAARKKAQGAAKNQGLGADLSGILPDEELIVVKGAPSQVWPNLVAFWKGQGFGLDLNDEDLGVLETNWLENKEELTRGKFKVFAEPGQTPGTTALYLSHEAEAQYPQGEKLVWKKAPRDKALEDRMASEMSAALGGQTESAPAVAGATTAAPQETGTVGTASATMPAAGADAADAGASAPAAVAVAAQPSAAVRRAQMVSAGDGRVYLSVPASFHEAWRTTGEALEQIGVKVENQDPVRGVYTIRYSLAGDAGQPAEKKSLWSRLAFWRSDDDNQQYQVSVTGVGSKSEVVVLNHNGKWDGSEAAGRILSKLLDRINDTLAKAGA